MGEGREEEGAGRRGAGGRGGGRGVRGRVVVVGLEATLSLIDMHAVTSRQLTCGFILGSCPNQCWANIATTRSLISSCSPMQAYLFAARGKVN